MFVWVERWERLVYYFSAVGGGSWLKFSWLVRDLEGWILIVCFRGCKIEGRRMGLGFNLGVLGLL